MLRTCLSILHGSSDNVLVSPLVQLRLVQHGPHGGGEALLTVADGLVSPGGRVLFSVAMTL